MTNPLLKQNTQKNRNFYLLNHLRTQSINEELWKKKTCIVCKNIASIYFEDFILTIEVDAVDAFGRLNAVQITWKIKVNFLFKFYSINCI